MSTYMAKAGQVDRKWYVIDAAGKPLGRVAAQAAVLLRGKHKPTFTPHVDCGDFVVIINAEQAVLTGKKLEQKYYRTHSGYPGGLHETQYKKLMKDKPELAMRLAVRGMLQKNTIAQWQLKRLKIYRGAEHPHAAQKPEVWDR
jgi:large subunit ribosomal protein L13